MIQKILTFIKKIDRVIVQKQSQIKIYQKGKDDIVTEMDLLISKLFVDFIKKNFEKLDYSILDEENISQNGILDSEYQFILDPIDGTLPYSLNMPLYGISVGVFKKGYPLYGFIYMPTTKELVYCDDKSVFLIEKAFSRKEKKIQLQKNSEFRTNLIFDTLFFVTMNDNLIKEKFICCSFFSTVVQLLYVSTFRARGSYISAFLWDIAGAWPILNKLGFQIKHFENLSILENITLKHFDKNFHMKGVYIVSLPQDFKRLKKIADIRKNQ